MSINYAHSVLNVEIAHKKREYVLKHTPLFNLIIYLCLLAINE